MGKLDLETALASCNYYPASVDLCRRVIWFAEIERETYRRAGFLVPKQAAMSEERYGFNLDDVLLHDLSLPIGGAPSHYIFISAFCCSTLLARLLDRVPGCLVLREPSVLGQLGMMRYRTRDSGDRRSPPQPEAAVAAASASPGRRRGDADFTAGETPAPQTAAEWEEEWQTWAALGMRLLTRTFDPGQTVIVKAADVCNTMPEVILANDSRSKAVMLSVGLRTFVLSVLKDEKRKDWTRKRAIFWQKHLTLFPALNGVNVPELGDAEKAAYLWLVTAALWDQFRKQVDPERLLPMDGDEVSEDPGGALKRVAGFFRLPLEESRVREILADPVLGRHSKFPGQAYDGAKRRSDREDWEERFGADADRAIEWAAGIREAMESDGIDFSSMANDEVEELAL
ncbi:MAG: hypothetical protein ACRD3D_02150 [Terriglobia bacterium]